MKRFLCIVSVLFSVVGCGTNPVSSSAYVYPQSPYVPVVAPIERFDSKTSDTVHIVFPSPENSYMAAIWAHNFITYRTIIKDSSVAKTWAVPSGLNGSTAALICQDGRYIYYKCNYFHYDKYTDIVDSSNTYTINDSIIASNKLEWHPVNR